nr:hypothetical protein [Enterococcus sp. 665A]MBO1340307.1 hypothetical protein [Enterococcus sp. 665A]
MKKLVLIIAGLFAILTISTTKVDAAEAGPAPGEVTIELEAPETLGSNSQIQPYMWASQNIYHMCSFHTPPPSTIWVTRGSQSGRLTLMSYYYKDYKYHCVYWGTISGYI